MKVVHITPTYFGPDSIVGGGERYATELAKAMAKLTPTRLVSFGEQTREEKWGELEVHIYEPLCFVQGLHWNPFSFGFLRSLSDAEVIHCHQYQVLPTTLSILYGHCRRKPVFVTELGGGAWTLSDYLGAEHWVKAFLDISEYAARDGRFRSGKHQPIWGGVHPELFQPRPIRRERQVLFVGRIRPAKGIHLLLEALPPGVPLQVVGPVVDPAYFKQISEASTTKNVRFDPECSDQELSRHYSSSWMTVLPSLPGTELLGLVLLESMACETPVICSRVGGMPEIVEDGVTGFVVPPENPEVLRQKICWLLENPEQARKMGEEGRRRVLEKFTWDRVTRRCLDIYQSYL